MVGINGNLNIFMSMKKDILLDFYEILFDSKNIGVYDYDGNVIVETKFENNKRRYINIVSSM